jgi:hypothetical protein
MGTGIQWVQPYNYGRKAFDLVLFTGTAYLYDWEWPKKFDRPRIDEQADVNPRTLRLLKAAGVVLFSLIALGALPWPRRWRIEDDVGAPRSSPEPWWRGLLWIGSWIVLPAYGFYCASVSGFVTPQQWLLSVGDAIRAHPLAAATVLALLLTWSYVAALNWRQRTANTVLAIGVPGAIVLLAALAAWKIETRPGSMWMPRYLGVIWPAFAIAVAVLLSRLPTRPLRWTAIALLVLVNLGQFSARVFATSEPPVDRMARDLIEAQPDDATMRTYYRVGVARIGAPGNSLLTNMPASTTSRSTATCSRIRRRCLGVVPRSDLGQVQALAAVSRCRWSRSFASDASRNPQLKRIVGVGQARRRWASADRHERQARGATRDDVEARQRRALPSARPLDVARAVHGPTPRVRAVVVPRDGAGNSTGDRAGNSADINAESLPNLIRFLIQATTRRPPFAPPSR